MMVHFGSRVVFWGARMLVHGRLPWCLDLCGAPERAHCRALIEDARAGARRGAAAGGVRVVSRLQLSTRYVEPRREANVH